jgi:EAL domain-containing protein (putative c-di-GMP-specific phosphodiesterase class I)
VGPGDGVRRAADLARRVPGVIDGGQFVGQPTRLARLYDHVRRALRQNAIVPATLILEVTESVLVANPAAVAKLARLKALGQRLAIDDFGTGESALSYLRRVSLNLLKIDRELSVTSSDSMSSIDDAPVSSLRGHGGTSNARLV